jgi:prepilin-type N-terminal cleavage/methylation domain-containing protein
MKSPPGRGRSSGHPSQPCRVPRQSAHGFSLVELLLVVALLGFLAAVAVPTAAKMIRRARVFGALASIRQVFAVASSRPSGVERMSSSSPRSRPRDSSDCTPFRIARTMGPSRCRRTSRPLPVTAVRTPGPSRAHQPLTSQLWATRRSRRESSSGAWRPSKHARHGDVVRHLQRRPSPLGPSRLSSERRSPPAPGRGDLGTSDRVGRARSLLRRFFRAQLFAGDDRK